MASIEGNIVKEDFMGNTCFFNPSPWEIVNYDNTNVLVNDGSGTNNLNTSISFTVLCNHLEIDYNVDSESGYDYLLIYVDGVQKVRVSGTGLTKQTLSLDLSNTSHTVQFKYSKDSSANKGRDRAEIYEIRYRVSVLEEYAIQDGDIIKGVPSTVTDATDISNIILQDMNTEGTISMSRSILNKVLSNNSLYGDNIKILLHSELPEFYVYNLRLEKEGIFACSRIKDKELIEITNSKITGISNIIIDSECDEGSVLKIVINCGEEKAPKVFNGTEWVNSVNPLEDGMSVSVVNSLTEEQLNYLFEVKKFMFESFMKKASADSNVKIKSIKINYKNI